MEVVLTNTVMRQLWRRGGLMAQQPPARWGAGLFGGVGLAFFLATLGRALWAGHLFRTIPLWLVFVQAGLLWAAWTVWGAVTTATWSARRRWRQQARQTRSLWIGAGTALGAGGVVAPTALVCAASCGMAGTTLFGLGSLATIGVATALAAWMPWLWGVAALVLCGLAGRSLLATAAPAPASVSTIKEATSTMAKTQTPSTTSLTSAPAGSTWNWATKEVAVLGAALALTIGSFGGYLVGGHNSAYAAPTSTTTPSTTSPSGGSGGGSGSGSGSGTGTGTGGSPSTTTSAFTAGQAAPWSTALETLKGQPAHLVRGTKGTLVVEMASWCLFCGYTDKYIVPLIAAMPGVAVDVVDVSPQGGIANPGPQSPPFSGHDGQGSAINTAQMATTMQQYVSTYGTLTAAHVFVAPSATRSAWNIQSFPTLDWINASGKVVSSTPGALTIAQAQAQAKSLGF